MIQNYDKISKWSTKFGKIYTLWKIHIYPTMINKMWSIGATTCILITSYKRFQSKILSYEKMKKDS
jgi:hypothetical protein